MAKHNRSRAVRTMRAVLWALSAWHVLEALNMRRRRERLATLRQPSGTAATGKVSILSVAGTEIDDDSRAALREEMEAEGVGVVDVIPGNLSVDRWLRLLRRLDVPTIGTDRSKHPGGADELIALHPGVAERMGVGGDETLDRGTLARQTTRAQRHAPGAHTIRLAPNVTAGELTGIERWKELEGLTAVAWPYAAWAPLLTAIESAHLLAMTAGAIVAPVPALVSLATWLTQPMLTLGPRAGDDQAPGLPAPGQLVGEVISRLPRAVALNLATIVAGYETTKAREAERAATPPPTPLSHEEQFEARRDTCAWCGSANLRLHHDVPDLLLHKPGTYHLDQCQDCGHVFQNPRLTPAGLDYIYDNAYGGTGAELAEISFAAIPDAYHSRVLSLEKFHKPTAVLDVGSAHAHFLLVAREHWPEARLDALDMSENVEEARRRGWADHAIVGTFPEAAESLTGTYDTVCMHHFLEHVRDVRAELAAAATVLDSGGYLMIEVPDPEAKLATTLGRYWYQWGQPEHLQLMPSRNLAAAVDEAGFEVLSVEHVTLRGEFLNSLGLALQHAARSPHLPWLPDPGLAHRVKRIAIYIAALPLVALAKLVDVVREKPFQQNLRLDTDQPTMAYRIVARRR
jgi:SAM-dependent methyltransferase